MPTELDGAVAQEVMGFRRQSTPYITPRRVLIEDGELWVDADGEAHGRVEDYSPSTEPEQAMEVWDEMVRRGKAGSLWESNYEDNGSRIWVDFKSPALSHSENESSAATKSLAICVAALKAVRNEKGKV
jgi:hypothetical protein